MTNIRFTIEKLNCFDFKIWKDVASEVEERDFNECRLKWQSLRCQYNQNASKKTRSGQGADETVKVHWRFFDAMQFVGKSDSQNVAGTSSNYTLVIFAT